MTATDSLSLTFAALADPTRRAILARLSEGETSVAELARPFAISKPAVSKHLKVLEDAGLVARRKAGRSFLCSLKAGPLGEADQWLRQWEKFWNVRLDRLEALIAEDRSE